MNLEFKQKLLQNAALAAFCRDSTKQFRWEGNESWLLSEDAEGDWDIRPWNPLINDSDVIELAVRALNWPSMGRAYANALSTLFALNMLPKDKHEATRLVITFAAFQIGEHI